MFNLIAHKINDEYSDFLDTHFYKSLMGQSRNNDLLAQRKEQLPQIAQLLRRDSDYYAKVLTSVKVTISDVPAYMTSIVLPTWTENKGQDDIKWYQATKQSDGSYTYTFYAIHFLCQK